MLQKAVDLYARLSQLLRLCIGSEIEAPQAPEALRAFLAGRCDLASFSVLEDSLREQQQSVRAVFRNVMS